MTCKKLSLEMKGKYYQCNRTHARVMFKDCFPQMFWEWPFMKFKPCKKWKASTIFLVHLIFKILNNIFLKKWRTKHRQKVNIHVSWLFSVNCRRFTVIISKWIKQQIFCTIIKMSTNIFKYYLKQFFYNLVIVQSDKSNSVLFTTITIFHSFTSQAAMNEKV